MGQPLEDDEDSAPGAWVAYFSQWAKIIPRVRGLPELKSHISCTPCTLLDRLWGLNAGPFVLKAHTSTAWDRLYHIKASAFSSWTLWHMKPTMIRSKTSSCRITSEKQKLKSRSSLCSWPSSLYWTELNTLHFRKIQIQTACQSRSASKVCMSNVQWQCILSTPLVA